MGVLSALFVVAESGDVVALGLGQRRNVQLCEANATHDPDYDEPDQTGRGDDGARGDMVRLKSEWQVPTHAQRWEGRAQRVTAVSFVWRPRS